MTNGGPFNERKFAAVLFLFRRFLSRERLRSPFTAGLIRTVGTYLWTNDVVSLARAPAEPRGPNAASLSDRARSATRRSASAHHLKTDRNHLVGLFWFWAPLGNLL